MAGKKEQTAPFDDRTVNASTSHDGLQATKPQIVIGKSVTTPKEPKGTSALKGR